MTKEQKDKICKALVEDRNYYARECESHIVREQGKITGADYMLQRFLDILNTEVDPQESEVQDADTETWNGYHGRVTAPKGTFKRIYADADGGNAE